jgi:thioredoxin-dependent peroxiredoxin
LGATPHRRERPIQRRTVPLDVVFKTRVRDETIPGPNPHRWEDRTSADLFRGKRVVVFSLPGAFTPTCTNRQCPAYDLMYDQFRTHGIDEVYCISVNDAFVMHQWARSLGLQNVKLIPDGNGQFTRRMGMLINKEHLGFGYRSWRYAMVVDDGVVENWFEEPGINDTGGDDDPYGETDPEQVLRCLDAASPKRRAQA